MSQDNKKHKFKQPRKTERVVVGESQAWDRERENLLANAEYGYGKTEQRGKNLLYTVGSDQFGYVEYLILNAKLPE